MFFVVFQLNHQTRSKRAFRLSLFSLPSLSLSQSHRNSHFLQYWCAHNSHSTKPTSLPCLSHFLDQTQTPTFPSLQRETPGSSNCEGDLLCCSHFLLYFFLCMHGSVWIISLKCTICLGLIFFLCLSSGV